MPRSRSGPAPQGGSWSDIVRRTAWLMLGAAIGLAAGLLAFSLAQVLAPVVPVPAALLSVVCLLPIPLLGLLPGIRELEVTAARGMLGCTTELVMPEHARAEHRLRCVSWVTLHLVMGLAAAVLLLGLVPGAVVYLSGGVTGEPLPGLPPPTGRGPMALVGAVLAANGISLVGLALVWLLGRLARRMVPTFLGPTATDLLALVEIRLAAEAEHSRLARELHDGIGHALTIITVQAASGRRGLQRGSSAPGPALEIIESTAQQALAELDTMLGVLRDGPETAGPEPGLDRLEQLAGLYRSGGLEIETDLGDTARLAPPVSRTAYQIIAEALANAQRYAGDGLVRVHVDAAPEGVIIEVTSALREPGLARRGRARGRGLDGIRERVRLFGGTVDAGPRDRCWVLRATLPTTVRHA